MKRYDRILGSLAGAAIGNAMGAPLETCTPYLIKKELGNGELVRDYVDMPYDSPIKGIPRGTVSYDFAISYLSLLEFVKAGGVTKEASARALLELKNNQKYAIYAARTDTATKVGLDRIEGVKHEWTPYDDLPVDNRYLTSSAAMKSWVCGVWNPGKVEKAIDDAFSMCLEAHDNVIALSAAASIAAATAVAMMDGTSLSDIIDAGILGAHKGYDKAMYVARKSAGASIEARIKLAVEIGLKYSNDHEKCIEEMTDLIGTGINANEAVPSVFGFLTASGGDVMKSIYLAINAGNDSDTTGVMIGAIAGAFKGIKAIPDKHLPLLSSVNDMDIEGLAKKIDEIV